MPPLDPELEGEVGCRGGNSLASRGSWLTLIKLRSRGVNAGESDAPPKSQSVAQPEWQGEAVKDGAPRTSCPPAPVLFLPIPAQLLSFEHDAI